MTIEYSILDKITDLLDDHVNERDNFRNSNTCSATTYAQQEQDMYDARYILLNFIEANLK